MRWGEGRRNMAGRAECTKASRTAGQRECPGPRDGQQTRVEWAGGCEESRLGAEPGEVEPGLRSEHNGEALGWRDLGRVDTSRPVGKLLKFPGWRWWWLGAAWRCGRDEERRHPAEEVTVSRPWILGVRDGALRTTWATQEVGMSFTKMRELEEHKPGLGFEDSGGRSEIVKF